MSTSKKQPPPLPPRSTRPQRSRKDDAAPLPAAPEADWPRQSPEELVPTFQDPRISEAESREARHDRYARRPERTMQPSSSAQEADAGDCPQALRRSTQTWCSDSPSSSSKGSRTLRTRSPSPIPSSPPPHSKYSDTIPSMKDERRRQDSRSRTSGGSTHIDTTTFNGNTTHAPTKDGWEYTEESDSDSIDGQSVDIKGQREKARSESKTTYSNSSRARSSSPSLPQRPRNGTSTRDSTSTRHRSSSHDYERPRYRAAAGPSTHFVHVGPGAGNFVETGVHHGRQGSSMYTTVRGCGNVVGNNISNIGNSYVTTSVNGGQTTTVRSRTLPPAFDMPFHNTVVVDDEGYDGGYGDYEEEYYDDQWVDNLVGQSLHAAGIRNFTRPPPSYRSSSPPSPPREMADGLAHAAREFRGAADEMSASARRMRPKPGRSGDSSAHASRR